MSTYLGKETNTGARRFQKISYHILMSIADYTIQILKKIVMSYCLILRILKTGISLEAMPPWVSENGFSSFQAVC